MSSAFLDLLDVSLDRYLDPFIPRNFVHHFPRPVSYFLGYRRKPQQEPFVLVQLLLMIFSTVAGLCVVGGVFNYGPAIAKWNPPATIASLGASAILDFNTIRSPLAQPRNALVGHTLAAIVGVSIAKLFMLAPEFFENYVWVVAAIACAAASLVMSLTNSVHPPGGATAILACTEKQIVALGWRFPPLILLASSLMLGVALLFNNTLRQYPVYWWSLEEVGSKLPSLRRRKDAQDGKAEDSDLEASKSKLPDFGEESDSSQRTLTRGHSHEIGPGEDVGSMHIPRHMLSHEFEFVEGLRDIDITPHTIRLPSHINLNKREMESLQALMARLSHERDVDNVD